MIRWLIGMAVLTAVPTAVATDWYVSPEGLADHSGRSQDQPMRRIQRALDQAQPGDTVYLLPGVYAQDIETVRDGRADAPITLAGLRDEGQKNRHAVVLPATLKGAGRARVVQIRHSHIHVQDFVVDGLNGDPADPDAIRDKLIFVHNGERKNGLEGIRIQRMVLTHAGGECLRLRHFVTDSEIAYNSIGDCGMHDFPFAASSKNGEAVYIGTSFKQWGDGKNPTDGPDVSAGNRVHHNVMVTRGNECVDLKEGTTANVVYANRCTGQLDANSAGFNSAGNGNVFRDNLVFGNAGSGFRFGSDKKGYGIDNVATGNEVLHNAQFGFKIMNEPQGQLCGNRLAANAKGAWYSDQDRGHAPGAACQPP